MSVAGKRLLILGGTQASYDLVKTAREMGVYTIVTDDHEAGAAKAIAHETAAVSTADIEGLTALCREKKVDGVFCGPSEFNLQNVIRVCEKAGYPCYTDMETWDRCAKKDVFKQFCRDCGVDTPQQYSVSEAASREELEKIPYPVIVKPVDGSSSAGVTVCYGGEELRTACAAAREMSVSGRIVVEQYIENGGEIFTVRYLLRDGQAVPYLTMDDYIVDPVNRTSLISGYIVAPSKYTAYYMENMDASVRRLLQAMGLKNGTAFIQALPFEGKIYLMEMGFRLSGGMMFKVTQPLMGVNDMKMMIALALGEPMFTDEEVKSIDFFTNPRRAGQLTVPLNAGTIGRAEGLEACRKMPGVTDVLTYYAVGDTVQDAAVGTLAQLFCRFTLVADSVEAMTALAEKIQHCLRIYDTDGNRMNTMQTDFSRLQRKS